MSAISVFIFIILAAFAGFMSLILGDIMEPFINSMADSALKTLFSFIFPVGFLLGIFVALTFALYMDMQKSRFRGGLGY